MSCCWGIRFVVMVVWSCSRLHSSWYMLCLVLRSCLVIDVVVGYGGALSSFWVHDLVWVLLN